MRLPWHSVHNLLLLYLQDMFGQEIELAPFKNIMEMLSQMKDVCTMEKPSSASGDWLVKSRSSIETEGNVVLCKLVWQV